MSRKVFYSLILSGAVLTVSFSNCSNYSSPVKFTRNTNTSTIGNPFTVFAASKVSEGICEKLVACHPGITLQSCLADLNTTPGFSNVLGVNYDTLGSIGSAEEAGSISSDLVKTDNCMNTVETLACTSSVVQMAYQANQSLPYSLSPNLLSSNTCQQVYTSSVNLEVPIELVDKGLSSSTSAVSFTRTTTSLDTADYDGSVQFKFEVIGQNVDGQNRSVDLIDSAGSVVASVSFPAGTNASTRLSSIFSTNGANQFRVRLSGTSVASRLEVTSARILVKQIGATRTKIYIPLVGGYAGDSVQSDVGSGAQIDLMTGVGYAQNNPHYYSRILKNSAAYADLDSANPWTLEVVLQSNAAAGSQAFVSLFNATTNQQVVESEVVTSSASPVLLSRSFSNSAAQFTDGQDMELRIRRASAGSGGALFKAGLWVKLVNLTHAEIYHRLASTIWQNTSSEKTYPFNMVKMEPSVFNKPVSTYHDSSGYAESGGITCMTSLLDIGTLDSGETGPAVANSNLSFTSLNKIHSRSNPLSLISGHSYIISVAENQSVNTCIVPQSNLILKF